MMFSSSGFRHEVKLMDTTTHEVFFDKLTFVYLEMPKFHKTEQELDTLFDKWMFVLKNLARLMERPTAFRNVCSTGCLRLLKLLSSQKRIFMPMRRV